MGSNQPVVNAIVYASISDEIVIACRECDGDFHAIRGDILDLAEIWSEFSAHAIQHENERNLAQAKEASNDLS